MSRHPSPDLSVSPIEHTVRADKLELLFSQSFPAIFVAVAMAMLLGWLVRDAADPHLLRGWLIALVGCAVARIALFASYFRLRPRRDGRLLWWERAYFVTLLVTCTTWGVGATALMAGLPPLQQAICLFVIIGMGGGAVSTYSAYRGMAMLAMLSILVPPTLWLLVSPQSLHHGLATGMIVFMVASLRAIHVLTNALHRSFQLSREMARAHDTAEMLARTDMLTGINNRRAFFERGLQLIEYCRRNGLPVCLLAMDVDHFKKINDTWGHAVGDEALKRVSDLLSRQLRKSDVYGRIGGEEFAVLLPDTRLADAQAIGEMLRTSIADQPIEAHGHRLPVTISIGVAADSCDLDVLLSQADAAMYRAKQAGRNRVVSA
jgi:diguanylate cyclase (GGDEF)-like protein